MNIDNVKPFPDRRLHVEQFTADDFTGDDRELFIRIAAESDIEILRHSAACFLYLKAHWRRQLGQHEGES